MSKLIHLPNIDRELEEKLLNSGISSPEKLREKGARNVFVKIKSTDSSANFQMLLALEGAIKGVLIDELKANDVEELKIFMEIFNR
ncbi:MAG: TfoX/Sxy family protein [Bacteroidales bacterium]|nr:TfoX/Sxy family protein [Bacteroidales bacterium]